MPIDPHESGPRLPPFAKQDADEALLESLNRHLAVAELPAPRAAVDPATLPLIYIVGAPRSGTTLLSQLLSGCLPVGYIDNLIARFWSRPSVGIALSRILLGADARKTIGVESTHGTTRGIAGPHEFGYFWSHWLRLDRAATHHLSAQDLAGIDAAGLKHALEREILLSFGRAVLFKNVICGFHAGFLAKLHPLSLFLHIERDPYDTCASVLKTRSERYGSYDTWWSLKPSTWPFGTPPGDPAAEVARQMLDCRREINDELARPGVRAHLLSYERLCADPGGAIAEICAKLAELGSPTAPLDTPLPRLDRTPATRLPPALEKRLKECLATEYNRAQ